MMTPILHQYFIEAKEQLNLKAVVDLVEQGADVNEITAEKVTPLMSAATFFHVDIIEYLIEKGADVNQVDYDGDSAMIYAIYGGYREKEKILNCVGKLLSNGANPNKYNKEGQHPAVVLSQTLSVSQLCDLKNKGLFNGLPYGNTETNDKNILHHLVVKEFQENDAIYVRELVEERFDDLVQLQSAGLTPLELSWGSTIRFLSRPCNL